ncbi:MAG: fumarylacetoacetate hydrolase family protein, partial [Chloroflexi bacterium]|nr:fumarylacetoacetate hydrolase family protein [Chloroflexota bacterium]
MKLVLYDDYTPGVLKGNNVVDIREAVKEIVYSSPQSLMNQIIAGFDRYKSGIEEIANRSQGIPSSRVCLRAPLPEPTRIVAMAVNYMEYGTRAKPADIDAFHKSPSCVIGPGDIVILPDCPATIFEPEAELALVIGKKASKIKAEDAHSYIFGYTNFIDVSARGLRPEGRLSFFWGKSWDTFGPLGPSIVTTDEVPDPQNLNVRLWINGKLYQDYPTSDMAHKIPRVLEWVSWLTTLYPGDIIACGTNHAGLCAIQDGDVLDMEIDGFGKLTVNVKDDLKRKWDRTPRNEKTEEQRRTIEFGT